MIVELVAKQRCRGQDRVRVASRPKGIDGLVPVKVAPVSAVPPAAVTSVALLAPSRIRNIPRGIALNQS